MARSVALIGFCWEHGKSVLESEVDTVFCRRESPEFDECTRNKPINNLGCWAELFGLCALPVEAG
jgi:hypothetical protein